MFEGLLAFERGSSRLVPALAQSWQISPDARTVEFHLRPGVHFHTEPYFTPTRDFNADDVLFTFGRMIDKQHPFNQAFPATFVYPENLGLAQMIERIEKVDAMTVRFHLTRPNVSFQNYFAMGLQASTRPSTARSCCAGAVPTRSTTSPSAPAPTSSSPTPRTMWCACSRTRATGAADKPRRR
jgi:ABC-type transport system substrate-binding protein